MKNSKISVVLLLLLFGFTQCIDDGEEPYIHDPDMATKVSVDRFSSEFGSLFVRTATNGLPAANEPIDMDQGPFITQGLGPQCY